MAASYTHTTRSSGTVLTDTIYNADHNNHITNMIPTIIDDFSANNTEMQTVRDPYPGSSISLATSLSEELSGIRFMIKQITGKAQWYIDAPTYISAGSDFDNITSDFITGGEYIIDVDGTAIAAAGAVTMGAAADTSLYWDGTNLSLDVATGGVVIELAGVQQAIIDAAGVNIITGNEYLINGASVLNATTLGSAVVASSLTSIGELSSINIATGAGYDINTTEVLNATTLGAAVVASSLTSLGSLTSLTMAGNIACVDNEIQKALLKDYAEITITVAAAGATETLDIENGNVFDITLDEACAFTFSNPITSGNTTSFTLLLRQNGTGGFATTWPASVDWANGSVPTLTTTLNSVSILTFITVDGGTIWHGMIGSSDSK